MKKLLLFATLLLSVVNIVDAQISTTLTNNWKKTLVDGNFTAIGTDSRCIAYYNGKLYFSDRSGTTTTSEKKIQIYDASTGNFIKAVTLSTINDANGNNSIRIDNSGNIIISNLTTDARTTAFHVWKMANEDDTPTLIIDYTAPTDGSTGAIRIDFSAIYGDVNGNGYIMAPITTTGTVDDQDKTILKWNINSGTISSTPDKIILQDYSPTSATSNGTFAQITPINESSFYFDGTTTYPTIYNMSGTTVDGFANTTGVTTPIAAANGIAHVELSGADFIVCGANTTTTYATSPVMNSFYLYKMGDGNTFSGMTLLNTFPATGMGGTTNGSSVVLPIIEKISETKANIYLYAYLNGFAKYELNVDNTTTNINNANSNKNSIVCKNGIIYFPDAAIVEMFSASGQKLLSKHNMSSISAPTYAGIYIVKTTNLTGQSTIQKLIVK